MDGKGEVKIIDGCEQIRSRIKDKYKMIRWIGFNTRRYDQPILKAILFDNYTVEKCYELSQKIIGGNNGPYCTDVNMVDLMEVFNSPSKCSLKEFGHRFKYPVLQNLPYAYDKELLESEWEEVKKYSIHDVKITKLFWDKLQPEQKTRELLAQMYGITLTGGSAKLAEKAILKGFSKEDYISTGNRSLIRPSNLSLSERGTLLADSFFNNDYAKSKPSSMADIYEINDLKLQFGVGGLHGYSKSGIYKNCYDYDVTSFYPAIILNCKLGSLIFRYIYNQIFDQRVSFKENKDQRADALKLILNSLYGKLKSEYSDERIFAPHIALNICLNGQLYILDLIEKVSHCNILLANTDGIITEKPIPQEILDEFMTRTKFSLGTKKIDLLILRDSNAYYAEYAGGKTKELNCFRQDQSYMHNTRAPVIARAAIARLKDNIPIEFTIRNHRDAFDFCYFTKTTKGSKLFLDGVELYDPKVRWYSAIKGAVLTAQTENSQRRISVESLSALAMNIDDFDFNNVNYDFYIKQAHKLVESVLKNEWQPEVPEV